MLTATGKSVVSFPKMQRALLHSDCCKYVDDDIYTLMGIFEDDALAISFQPH